jgi:hypothetical protein
MDLRGQIPVARCFISMKTQRKGRNRKKWAIIIAAAAVLLAVASVVKVTTILPGIRFVRSVRVEKVSDGSGQFSYQPAKMVVGRALHYVKSNLDGSKPVDVTLYCASADSAIEAFKIYAGTGATYYVAATMDWNAFCPRLLAGYEIRKDGKKHQVAREELSADRRSYTSSSNGTRAEVPLGTFPAHNYNFDLTSLNFCFSQLKDPEGQFTIGLIYPSFSFKTYVHDVYSGTVTVRYLLDENRDGKPCRKYSIGGQGLFGKQGYVWVVKDGEFVADMEIPVSDNPLWRSFKLKLVSEEKMTPREWKSYIGEKSRAFLGIDAIEDSL